MDAAYKADKLEHHLRQLRLTSTSAVDLIVFAMLNLTARLLTSSCINH